MVPFQFAEFQFAECYIPNPNPNPNPIIGIRRIERTPLEYAFKVHQL